MAKIVLICGKICAGKTTYSKNLMEEQKAVRLNPDEIMKSICGEYLGDQHEEILHRTLLYMYKKACEIYSTGINVVIDGGFWQRAYREEANCFFNERKITPEWHYVDVSDEQWLKNIKKRNEEVENGQSEDYFVDDFIIDKFSNPDDVPRRSEMTIWYKNELNY